MRISKIEYKMHMCPVCENCEDCGIHDLEDILITSRPQYGLETMKCNNFISTLIKEPVEVEPVMSLEEVRGATKC